MSERIRIEVLFILGYSTRFIAKFLHYHHSSIVQELSRNKIENKYISTFTHDKYIKHRKIFFTLRSIAIGLTIHHL